MEKEIIKDRLMFKSLNEMINYIVDNSKIVNYSDFNLSREFTEFKTIFKLKKGCWFLSNNNYNDFNKGSSFAIDVINPFWSKKGLKDLIRFHLKKCK